MLEDGVLSYYKLRGGGGGGESASPTAARVIGEDGALRRAREEAAAAGKQWKPFGEIHLKVWYLSVSRWIGFVHTWGSWLGPWGSDIFETALLGTSGNDWPKEYCGVDVFTVKKLGMGIIVSFYFAFCY